jgi:hypothetical protein
MRISCASFGGLRGALDRILVREYVDSPSKLERTRITFIGVPTADSLLEP